MMMREHEELVRLAHEAAAASMKRLDPAKTFRLARNARIRGGRTLPKDHPFVQNLTYAADDYKRRIADAEVALRLAVDDAAFIERACIEHNASRDEWTCPGWGRAEHPTTKRKVRGLCKPCYDRR